ncbi:MAG: amidase [bacterium]
MAKHDEILHLSATEQERLLQEGELSPTELVEACLAQVDELNDTINAIVTLNERALDDAKELEKKVAAGDSPGLLYGLPVGIKDVTPVAGLRTTFGSPLFANHIPAQDALVVKRLRQAGAIILGKTNCPEFAAGGNTWNDVFGVTLNPWNPKLSPGGSTGGGAAGLVTGMISLAEGTDLGGSLRIPASFCGLVGLRPQPGLVPTYPSTYLWDSYQVTGPMARAAGDVALMLQAVAGPDPASPIYQPTEGRDFVAAVRNANIRGLKIAYCKDIAGIGVDEDVEAVCRKAAFAMQEAGVEVEEIDLDLSFMRKPFLAFRGYWFVAQLYPYLGKADQFGVNVCNNIKHGLTVTPEELGAAEAARAQLWHLFRDFFQKYDHLLTPCMAVPPFPVEQNYPETIAGKKMETYIDWIAPTFVLNMTSLPVATVPAGLDKTGIPVGMQILGRQMGEEAVLAFARVFQETHDIGLPSLAGLGN